MLPESREGYLERYASLNFALLPLNGKKPYWEDWSHAGVIGYDAIKKTFLSEFPKANIGVLMEPSRLVALDIDIKEENGLATLEKLEYEHGFQDTLRSITGGGGQRLFYRAPQQFPVPTKHKFLPGIELLGVGAQAVVPPSIHPDTHAPYAWDMMDDELDWDHIRELPEWILAKVRELVEKPLEKAAPPEDRIKHPHRHPAMVSMAGIMRHRMAASEEEIFGYLKVFNQGRCDPPYDEAHVRQIAHSMMQYQPEDPRIVSGLAKAYGLLKAARDAEKNLENGFESLSGGTILTGDYKPLEPVITDMVYEGLTMVYGPPKIGKSFLTMQMAIATATGAPLFGHQKIVRPGTVLYMSLEEPVSQTYQKLKLLLQEQDASLVRDIHFCYSMPKLLDGGLEYLEHGIEKLRPTLCVVDSFRAISSNSKEKDIVEREYAHTTKLSELGKRMKTAIVLVHHGAKRNQGETLMDGAAGTHGMTAGADCVCRLSRAGVDGNIYSLQAEGREIKEYQFALEKNIAEGLGWSMIARGDDAKWSQEREDIFRYLREEGAQTIKSIATYLNKNQATVRKMLERMSDALQVIKVAGKYAALGDSLGRSPAAVVVIGKRKVYPEPL